MWLHQNYLNVLNVLYEPLELTEVSCYYCEYGLSNFNTSLFEDFERTSTIYSTPAHSSMHKFVDSSGSIGSPRFASSPNRRDRIPISQRKIRILAINFQSLRSKKDSLRALLEYSEPDIVLAS